MTVSKPTRSACAAEFLAQMLGEPRRCGPRATRAVARAGAIAYDGEHARVARPRGARARSCDCYGIVRDEYERLLGPVTDG